MASALEQSREPVDVLVCDIGLPDGSGLELVRRISARRPVKAIALSGYGSAGDLERSAQAGFAVHLTKPIAADKLLEAIETLCNPQTGGSGCLPLGARGLLALAPDDLERDLEAVLLVASEPHVAHPARPERPQRPVPAEDQLLRGGSGSHARFYFAPR